MPTSIGTLFNSLAIKAGIAADNPALKTLLASPELATINVDDELVTTIDSGLLSLEAAKNNHPEIKKVYTAAAYDGMDKHLISLLGTDTFDAADLDEIKNERSTSKKYELVISKLKAAKTSAKGADKDEINRQLAAAHEAARLAKEEVATVKATYEGQIATIHKTAAVKALFGNYKTIYDELPGDIKEATMEALINKSLQDKNAELKTDEHGKLVLVGKDGSNVFGTNHTLLTPQSLLDQTFAPILKVSGPPKAGPAAPRQQPAANVKVDEGAEAIVSGISNHNASVIDALSRPAASLI